MSRVVFSVYPGHSFSLSIVQLYRNRCISFRHLSVAASCVVIPQPLYVKGTLPRNTSFPKELSVPQCMSTCSIDLHGVLFLGLAFNNHYGVVPFPRLVTNLILDKNLISMLKMFACFLSNQYYIFIEHGLSVPLCRWWQNQRSSVCKTLTTQPSIHQHEVTISWIGETIRQVSFAWCPSRPLAQD